MSVCLTCKHRKECNRHWKDDIHAIGFTCYEEYRTNFERITESPEALAEWLDEHCDYCKEIQDVQCDKCPHSGRYCVHDNIWLEWLNEESIE